MLNLEEINDNLTTLAHKIFHLKLSGRLSDKDTDDLIDCLNIPKLKIILEKDKIKNA